MLNVRNMPQLSFKIKYSGCSHNLNKMASGVRPKPLLQLSELCSLQYGVLSTSRGAGGSLEIIQWAAQLPQNNSQRHVDYSC